MKAVRLHRHGGPEVLTYEEVPDPVPRSGEVLIEVRACALNHLDLWTRSGFRGRHPIRAPLPLVLGSDVAGIVRALGPALPEEHRPGWDPIAEGDAVVIHPGGGCGSCAWCLRGDDNYCESYEGIGTTRDGGYAEYLTVPARDVVGMPDHLDFVEAASLPLTYLTAWHMIVRKARVRPADHVLIHAAGSGVGAAALQLVKVLGATVVATASTEEKLEKARKAGADATVNYSSPGFGSAVRELTGGRGVDVVVDSVGSWVFEESIEALATGGRVVSCGATADALVELDLHRLQEKRCEFHFTVMGSRADLLDVLHTVRRFELRPVIDRVLPLARAAEGHRVLEERRNFGKVVLVPGEESEHE